MGVFSWDLLLVTRPSAQLNSTQLYSTARHTSSIVDQQHHLTSCVVLALGLA